VASGLLRPAGPGLAGRHAFAATVPGNLDVAQDDRAGVGTTGTDVGVPTGATVPVEFDALDRPVAEAAGIHAARGHAMDVDVVEPDILRGPGIQSHARPRHAAVASRRGIRMLENAIAPIGDF